MRARVEATIVMRRSDIDGESLMLSLWVIQPRTEVALRAHSTPAVNFSPSVISYQSSVISRQLSVVSYIVG